MTTTRKWDGLWIADNPSFIDCGREYGTDLKKYVRPAPYLRKRFVLSGPFQSAVLYLASGGWHELYVNGVKADDRVLTPCMSQFNVHVNYLEYDLTGLLRCGENAITVLLGNGAFNSQTNDVWNFNHTAWRDYPRMRCDLVVDGKLALRSDRHWKCASSPIVFDSWRSGEAYDFVKEIPGVFEADFDDSAWGEAFPVRPAPGELILEEMEPCRICEKSAPVSSRQLDGETICYDMGKSITGWAEVEIELAEALSEPVEMLLEFSDRLNPDGTADRPPIAAYTLAPWDFQTGRITLAPGGTKFLWRPHFTYYGYQFIHLHCKELKKIKLLRVEAQFIHNDFADVGDFTSSNEELNRLQAVIRRSFLTNFTGIPTDCPHREKLGWTGDHSMAMATGLWNFDAIKAYKHFLQIFVDTQRPSGELAPIAPNPGWWWNCGPGFDYVLFQGAWELYRIGGDDSVIRHHYDAMKRYLQFTEFMEVDGLVEYGLGDWGHPERELGENSTRMASMRLVCSAWVYSMWERLAVFAKMTGHEADVSWAQSKAAQFRQNIRREFLHDDGSVDRYDQAASLACVLFFHFCTEEEAPALVARLVKRVRDFGHKADFGIFGAKWIPRVLGDYGYAEDALKIFLQKEFPGYGYMLEQGATTLWEFWNGKDSRDHTMFGDPSAWCFEYLAGIRPRFDGPAFMKVDLVPNVVPQLDSCQAHHTLPNGRGIQAGWQRQDGKALYTVAIPAGTQATLRLPGKAPQMLQPGEYSFEI